MNKIFEAELLKSAIEIGQDIIDKATIDANGIHWKTVRSLTRWGDIETGVDETISTGVSGILLFYIELYKSTKSDIYLEYVNSSAGWLISHCQKTPATHGFYSGRMGVVFTLLKVSEITQPEYYRNEAVNIASQFKNISSVPIQNYNLYNGLAGSILGLLHLHAQMKQYWILDSLYEGVEYLIKNSKSGKDGFYWDIDSIEKISINAKPLCSMPLGSSGIGLLFLHLGNYFDNKDYEYIGIQALKYEDQYFDNYLNNWPDFRIFVDQNRDKELTKSYFKGDHSQFEPRGYCANWMYGIVGHSFSRLLVHDILKDKYSAVKEIENANNIGDRLPNYTLATGKSGLGLLLLTYSLSTKNDSFFASALDIAKIGIDEKKVKGFYQFGFNVETEYEDDSLLMGNAGIGYYYLKLLSRDNDCILFPTLSTAADKNQDHKIYNFNIHYAIDKIIRAWYPNTFDVLDSRSLPGTSGLNFENLKSTFTSYIISLKDIQISDACRYDDIKLSVQEINNHNYGLFNICRSVEVSKSQNLLENNLKSELMKKTLQLNQYSHFITTKWNWKNGLLGDSRNNTEVYTLYSLCEEYSLSKITYEILCRFKTPKKVGNVYKFFNSIKGANGEDPDYLMHSYFQIILFFIRVGVLTLVKRPLLYKRYLNFNPMTLKDSFEMS